MQSTFVRSLVFPLLIALLLISLGPTPVTQAATVNLNVDRFDDPAVASPGVGAAACSPTALSDCSLRGAILTANIPSSDVRVINLPAGTYTLTQSGATEDSNKTGDLDIVNDMTIAGAGASTTVINGNNLDRVLSIHAGNVTISGVTIKGGKAPDGPAAIPDMFPSPGQAGQSGGGIINTAALTLTNCIITGNQTGAGGAGADSTMGFLPSPGGPGGAGGGIYNNGALTVISTTVSSNSAGNGGAGASASGPPAPFPAASGGNGGDGGGIYNMGTLTVTGTIVQSNNAGSGGNGGAAGNPSGGPGGNGGNGGNGGGIYNGSFIISGNLSLARTTVSGNVTGNGGAGGAGGAGVPPPIPGLPAGSGGAGGAGGKGGNGSAIYNTAQATVTNSTLSGNTAGNGGAGANGGTGGAGSISPPSAGGNGGNGGTGGFGGDGGIYNNSIFATATFTATSATITANTSGNRGSPGSGGAGGGGTPSGNNGSPGANGTVGTGGGVAIYGGVLSLKNTILANNTTPAAGQGPDCFGTITSQGYNLIRTLTNCTVAGSSTGNITGQDPKLSALADNGGGTLTHALQSTSPARNAADPAGCRDAAGTLLLVDQRGLPRTYGGRCDIGAFELQSSGLFLPLIRR